MKRLKRLSRHTVVVLVIALLACIGGLSLAVVAFGQAGQNMDATVPLGDYTTTTPATAPSTAPPLSGYTNTTATTPPSATTPSKPSSSSGSSTSTSGSGHTRPSHPVGTTRHSTSVGGGQPSRATRPGPTHLAFTGGEPILIGSAGMALMLAGLGLQLRRRRRAQPGS